MAPRPGLAGGGQVVERQVADREAQIARVHDLGAEARDEARRARGRLVGLGREVQDRMIDLGVEKPRDPLERLARGARVALQGPAPGQHVMHAPEPPRLVEQRPVAHLEHRHRGAGHHAELPRRDDAGSEQAALGIAAPDGNRGAGEQPELGRRRVTELAQGAARGAQLGEDRARQLQPLDPIPRPFGPLDFEQQRLARL